MKGVEGEYVSQEDIETLLTHKEEIVQKAGKALLLISQDSESKMFMAIQKVIDRICDDLNEMAEKGVMSNDRSDKIFDRFNVLMKSHSDYVLSLQSGVSHLQKIGLAEKEVESSNSMFLNNKKK